MKTSASLVILMQNFSSSGSLFDALVGLGGACVSFLDPFLAEMLGFLNQFLIASGIFFLAYVVLKIFQKK